MQNFDSQFKLHFISALNPFLFLNFSKPAFGKADSAHLMRCTIRLIQCLNAVAQAIQRESPRCRITSLTVSNAVRAADATVEATLGIKLASISTANLNN